MTEEEEKIVGFVKQNLKSQVREQGYCTDIKSHYASSNFQYELDRIFTAIKLRKNNLSIRLNLEKDGVSKKRKVKIDISEILKEMDAKDFDVSMADDIGSLKPMNPDFWDFCYSYKVNQRKQEATTLVGIILFVIFGCICLKLGLMISEGIVKMWGISFKKDLINGIMMFFSLM